MSGCDPEAGESRESGETEAPREDLGEGGGIADMPVNHQCMSYENKNVCFLTVCPPQPLKRCLLMYPKKEHEK